MSKRPTINDEAVIHQAAALLAAKMEEWLTGSKEAMPNDRRIEDIKDSIRHNNDGFSIAVELQDIGYDPDTELVNILDETLTIKSKLVQNACEDWVEVNELSEPELGAKVLVNGKEGIVIKNHKDGRSTVNIPALGHVMNGSGTYGKVINWEDLEIIETEGLSSGDENGKS
jgi:hypothetical protein